VGCERDGWIAQIGIKGNHDAVAMSRLDLKVLKTEENCVASLTRRFLSHRTLLFICVCGAALSLLRVAVCSGWHSCMEVWTCWRRKERRLYWQTMGFREFATGATLLEVALFWDGEGGGTDL
jgi:hypothetical protein